MTEELVWFWHWLFKYKGWVICVGLISFQKQKCFCSVKLVVGKGTWTGSLSSKVKIWVEKLYYTALDSQQFVESARCIIKLTNMLQQPVIYLYAMLFSISGYLGIQIVLTLVQTSGALVAVTVTTCRKAVTIIMSFVFFTKPFTIEWVLSKSVHNLSKFV